MQMLAITSSRLIVEATEQPIEHGVVIVHDGKIVETGSKEILSKYPGCDVIDCSDQTVMPALVDSHSHPGFCGANRYGKDYGSIFKQTSLPPILRNVRMFLNCISDMRSGVTTIRSLGTTDDSDIDLRDEITAGTLFGPRLIASGIPIRPSHGTAAFLGKPADGPDEVRKAVRERFSKGADVIKVFATNVQGGTSDVAYRKGDLTDVPGYSFEELRIICEEAHSAGIKVAAHAIGGKALRWAMEAGADSVEHVNLIEAQDIEVFLKTGCVLSDPNFYLFFDEQYGFRARSSWRELPQWWQEKVHEAEDRTRRYQREAYQAGVPFALALDSGHGVIWREALCMVNEIGAATQETLKALTRTSARLCGFNNLGALKPGYMADIISVEGNPLEDITCLAKVGLVMKDGKRYDLILDHMLEAYSEFEKC
jgi:imidazolonepropionase-like amidohydrolase